MPADNIAAQSAALDTQAVIEELVLRLTRKVCGEIGGCTRRCRRSWGGAGVCFKAERQRAAFARKRQKTSAAPRPERRLTTRSERCARIRALFRGPPRRPKRRQPTAPAVAQLSQYLP